MTLDFNENENENEIPESDTQNDEELFSGFDDTIIDEGEQKKERRAPSANRNFFIAVGVLGGIFLIALIALVVFVSLVMPARSAAMRDQIEKTNMAITSTAQALTLAAVAATDQAAQALVQTATALAQPTQTAEAPTEEAHALPSDTPEPAEPTETSVVVEATETVVPTEGESPTESGLSEDERQETLDALLTQLAAGGTATVEGTPTGEGLSTPITQSEAMTSTALASTPGVMPDTGIADDMRIALIIGGAFLLVIVILVARRLRFSNR